jgi:quercetin dioxygenase-like cupin family protein
MTQQARRFVTRQEAQIEPAPHCTHEWLCRPGLVEAEKLLLVRATMPAGRAHAFHTHPGCEEIIYIVEGRAEQWVETQRQMLGPGDVAHIPAGAVHATYNTSDRPLVFLAILSPAVPAPGCVDVSGQEPWSTMRQG